MPQSRHDWNVAQLCVAALLGALTVLGLMIVFLALCVVMRAIASCSRTLRADFEIAPMKCYFDAVVTLRPPQ
jgi:hypothetical protein